MGSLQVGVIYKCTHSAHLNFSHSVTYFSNSSLGTLESYVLKNLLGGFGERISKEMSLTTKILLLLV